MHTEYLILKDSFIKSPEICRAVQLLAESQIVAFPTETVYGIGARAFDELAIKKIFMVKKRPAGQALLVHISQIEQAESIAARVTGDALLLMEKFWPGALSIILPAAKKVPLSVTGGEKTVGLRVPSHPAARHLIDMAGPLAATSANLSGRPSALTAAHVKEDLGGKIAAVLDGGPTGLGIESTIIDLSCKPYKLLRLGGVSAPEVEKVLQQEIVIRPGNSAAEKYQTGLMVADTDDWDDFNRKIEGFRGKSIAIAGFDQAAAAELGAQNPLVKKTYCITSERGGSNFFSILREAEKEGIEVLVFTPLPKGLDLSIRDRICRSLGITEGEGNNA